MKYENTIMKGISRWDRIGSLLFSNFTVFFASVIILLLIGLVIILTIDALPSINKFGLGFFTSRQWNPVTESFGALPAIFGTLLSSVIGLLIAVPISLGTAIYLVEIAPDWVRGPVSFLVELLAAIPSVIIGLWGLFVLVPFIRNPIQKWLSANLGDLLLFQGPPFGVGFLSAGVILTIMIIPIITAVSRDVIKAVPNSQREAMLALGATRWEMIRDAVLPYSRSGLVGAVILGLGRAFGETMAVTMVIGNQYKISPSLFAPDATISSTIANEFSEAPQGGVLLASLMELALILFGVTLIINIIARVLVVRLTSVKGNKE